MPTKQDDKSIATAVSKGDVLDYDALAEAILPSVSDVLTRSLVEPGALALTILLWSKSGLITRYVATALKPTNSNPSRLSRVVSALAKSKGGRVVAIAGRTATAAFVVPSALASLVDVGTDVPNWIRTMRQAEAESVGLTIDDINVLSFAFAPIAVKEGVSTATIRITQVQLNILALLTSQKYTTHPLSQPAALRVVDLFYEAAKSDELDYFVEINVPTRASSQFQSGVYDTLRHLERLSFTFSLCGEVSTIIAASAALVVKQPLFRLGAKHVLDRAEAWEEAIYGY